MGRPLVQVALPDLHTGSCRDPRLERNPTKYGGAKANRVFAEPCVPGVRSIFPVDGDWPVVGTGIEPSLCGQATTEPREIQDVLKFTNRTVQLRNV